MLPGFYKDLMIPYEWPYECRSKRRAKLFMLPGLYKDLMIPYEWPYECRPNYFAGIVPSIADSMNHSYIRSTGHSRVVITIKWI